ncbi:MAG: hypothetical protein WCX97_04820 [Candidatus Magasanikbacteria bacterium]
MAIESNIYSPQMEIEDIDRTINIIDEDLLAGAAAVRDAEGKVEHNQQVMDELLQLQKQITLDDFEKEILERQKKLRELYLKKAAMIRLAFEADEFECNRRKRELLKRKEVLEKQIN